MMQVFAAKMRLFSRITVLLAGAALAGCFADPDTDPEEPGVPAAEEEALDSLLFSAREADRVVSLYRPRLDLTLPPDGASIRKEGLPRQVLEHGSGEVVEYRWSERSFGRWNAAREREFNLYVLRAYFLTPVGLFEDTAGLSTTASLYARAQQHDAFTRYIDSAEAEDYRRQLLTTEEPKAVGIQVHVNDAGDTLSFAMVAPGSPADRAGFRRGMRLLAVNDSSVAGDSADARFVRFFDRDAESVRLTVKGPQGVFSRELVREAVAFPSVIADSLSGVGYIAVSSFTSTTLPGASTLTEFRAALAATKNFPVTILDLRGNGGGSFGITLEMCDEVIGEGVFFRSVQRRFETNGSSRRFRVTYNARKGQASEGRRFVLLADSGSASASELLITAMRERLNAPFRGTRTYGKGVGQVSFDTPGKGYALVTYARVNTASGLDYNGVGLEPTHPSTAKSDAMLAEAVLQAKSLPGLAKGAGSASIGGLAGRAALADWNRRQMRRPGVYPLLIPEAP
jgi:C-terminal peptidase prc